MALPKRYRRSGNGKLVVAAGRYLEGWIPLRGQGGLSLASGKLERLDTLDPSLQKDLPAFHEQAVAAVQRRGEVYGVPHHLDFGFYAVRSDLLGCDVDQPDGDRELMTVTTEQGTKTLSLDESWTWNEIYELWRAVAKARRTQRAKARIDGSVGVTSDLGSHSFDLRALDCSSNQVDESYLCFILEVLWPWLQKEEGVVDIERLTSECVLEATCEMYRQLNRLNVLPMRLSGRSDDVDERSVTEGDHVQDNIDLLAEHRLPICAEITIPGEYCLMGCGSLENVRRIYSHSQALAQCKKSIHRLREAFGDRENWQRLELVPTSSTTAAAAKAQGEPDAAVIATPLAGAIWQLAVLNEHLEDDPSNRTRFVIIGHERVPLTGRDRTSIWFRMPDRPGGLFSALKHLAHLNMTALVSLPIKTTPWVYAFFLEFEGHSSDPEVNQALDGLKAMCQDGDLRILGSYPQDLRP